MDIAKDEKLKEHREILKKLACFTAPVVLGKDELPGAILDNLVEHALFLHKKSVKLNDISEIIKKQFKLSFEIDEIRSSVDRLAKRKVVVKNIENIFLETRHRCELEEIVNKKIDQEGQIIKKLEDHIKKQYPSLSAELIARIIIDFRLFLANFFLLSGAEAVQLIYGNPGQIEDIIGKAQKNNLIDSLPTTDLSLKMIEQKEFYEFISLLCNEDKLYLQDLLDRSLQYFTITVDKKCEALLTADFVNWSLFVDTNFIYNLLGFNKAAPNPRRKNTEKILDLCKRAHINFYVSPVTLEEFTRSVSRAKEVLLNDGISRKLYKVAGDTTGNAILSAYYEAYKHQNISPRDFLAKTDNIREVLDSYGIGVRNDYSNSLKESKEFRDTVNRLIALTHKDQNVAEHDAFHYLLILKLRHREGADNTFKTNKTWFLTYDGILAPFDHDVRKSEIPFCIRPYQIRQLLRPLFSRTDDFENVFLDFVAEPTARALPAISMEIAVDVLSRITYYENEFCIENSPELATKLLTNQLFLAKIRELSKDGLKTTDLIDKEIENSADMPESYNTNDSSILNKETQKQALDQYSINKQNYWNYVNPFWLIWQCIKKIKKILNRVIFLARKHRVVSVFLAILSFLALDYAKIFENFYTICSLLY